VPPATPPTRTTARPPRRRRRLRLYIGIALALPLVILLSVAGYYYIAFARIIDERLHGERMRTLPRVFARPFEIRRGQWLSSQQLADRLNDLGYSERARTTASRSCPEVATTRGGRCASS
jgi:hypothetical protein